MAAPLPWPVIDLVPHRAPMLLLDRLVSYAADFGRAVGRIQRDNPFLHSDGKLDPASFIEYVAQAAAAHEGYKRLLKEGCPAGGFLVGVRNFRIEGEASVGERIETVARRGLRFESFQVVEGAVEVEGRRVASGELKILVSDEGLQTEARPLEGKETVPVTSLRRQALDREGMRAEYLLDGSVAAFHGHFPGSPIFPAVASIALAEDSVKAMEDGHLELRAVKSAKFRAPLPPGSVVTNRCQRQSAADRVAWKVRTYLADAVAAEMQLEFQEGKRP